MRTVDIIVKKRDKGQLSKAEIDFFIQGFTRGEIPDYQAAALCMAILLNGMTATETTDLTMAMAYSGTVLDLSSICTVAVDKHSTGGVGDKTTLVVEPAVAACGVPVAKMSGRGLGFSGGTVDKIESIPGVRTSFTTREFLDQLRSIGIVLAGQSSELAPADGKLYALRDVTGTIRSIPLIASSIMSKKIAAGAQAIVLDVKVGLGAFMPDLEHARQLANTMVSIARIVDRKAIAVLADMNQPLGCAVGNGLEVQEAIATLHNAGPDDFYEHCLELAGHMLHISGNAVDLEEGKRLAAARIEDGSALEVFRKMVAAQGGDPRYVDDPGLFAKARIIRPVPTPKTGYLSQLNARLVGEASLTLGAGRTKKEDAIDLSVGVICHRKVGDLVNAGDPLFTIHAQSEDHLQSAAEQLRKAVEFSDQPVDSLPLFYGTIL